MNACSCLVRRLKTALLALALALPVSGWAQFNYTINNGAVTITKFNDSGSAGNVVIPSTISGFPVKSIGANAFFTGNSPSSLTGVTIPDSVTNIGSHAFDHCYNVTNFTIGNGVTTIGDNAFDSCFNLRSLTLPDSATNLGYGLFESCNSLTNVTLPIGLTRIPSSLFINCFSLPGEKIPAGVTIIERLAFYNCVAMTNVTIPNSVTTIGDGAFNSCYALPSVTIPPSVISIGDAPQVFGECVSLTNISVNGLNPAYSSVDGVLFNKAVTSLIQFPEGRSGGYAVPMSVTNIPEYGFSYCQNLTSVSLPPGLPAIRDNTFLYATALTNVTIPNSVTSIGAWAFASCSALTSVTIPGSVTNIGISAFNPCENLHQAYFLGNAPSVDGLAGSADDTVFGGGIGTVFYPPGTTGWAASFGSRPTAPGAYHPQPQILGSGPGFGVTSNQFSFTISWAPNTPIVVEASTNLVNWTAIATNQSASGTNAFGDASRTNYPHRFYRARSF